MIRAIQQHIQDQKDNTYSTGQLTLLMTTRTGHMIRVKALKHLILKGFRTVYNCDFETNTLFRQHDQGNNGFKTTWIGLVFIRQLNQGFKTT